MKTAQIRRKAALRGAELAARATRTMPGALGVGSLIWAGHLIWPPLAFAVAGFFLLLVDWATR